MKQHKPKNQGSITLRIPLKELSLLKRATDKLEEAGEEVTASSFIRKAIYLLSTKIIASKEIKSWGIE